MPLWTDSRILIPGLIIVALLLGCLLANYLSPYDPHKIALGRPYAQSSREHPLGLDNAGRDILSRILHGGRLTLGISIASVFIAAFVGTVLGMMAAYFAGLLDTVIMRGADVLLCFPPIILGMAIVTFVGSEPFWLILVIALLYTPRFMRVAYATVQTVKHNEYVEAARALGAPVPRILRKEIIPNILAPILVQSKAEAIDWASRAPFADDEVIEVRQVFETSDFPPEILPPEAAAREQAWRDEQQGKAAQP